MKFTHISVPNMPPLTWAKSQIGAARLLRSFGRECSMSKVNLDNALRAVLYHAHGRGVSTRRPNIEITYLQNALLIAWELLDAKGQEALIEEYHDRVAAENARATRTTSLR